MTKRIYIYSKHGRKDVIAVMDDQPGQFFFTGGKDFFDLPSAQEAFASMLEFIAGRDGSKVTIRLPQDPCMSDPLGVFGIIRVDD